MSTLSTVETDVELLDGGVLPERLCECTRSSFAKLVTTETNDLEF